LRQRHRPGTARQHGSEIALSHCSVTLVRPIERRNDRRALPGQGEGQETHDRDRPDELGERERSRELAHVSVIGIHSAGGERRGAHIARLVELSSTAP